ncbi:MAG: hypothetical protein KF834_06440 [Burkholderiales bacterium]|nr:hypothetical protein [Burkholderiales bacterium]
MDARRPHATIRGFSLIEVAVVLFIITLVMGSIIALLNAMVANRQIESTRTKQEAIKTALIGFIARNHRLPCPALATLPESNTNEGVETPRLSGNCTGITASGTSPNQVVTGTVPWVSLGLTREASLDAYANRFTYQVTLGATSLTSSTISGMTGRIIVLGASGGSQINDCSNGATVNPCAGVVAIVSHGKDGYGAYTRSGIQIRYDTTNIFPPEATSGNAFENADGDSTFVIKDYSDTSTDPFDDIVAVLTTNDLLAPLLVAGTLKDYRATLNNTFQIIQAAVIAYGVDNRSGSSGNRSYPVPSSFTFPGLLASSQTTDPWGTAIVYTRTSGISPITSGSNSGSVAITLTSHGPDKASGGGDDIVQTIYVSDLQNIFQLSGW